MSTRALRRVAVAGCVAALGVLAGCPRFHAEPLEGAPAGLTYKEVDGVHVRYREAGQGPAVVLLHGYGASADSWAPVIPTLAATHRVIAVDLKGFGWTTRPAGDYSPAAEAALVWAVLDQLGVTDVAIVGHSWGSSVALAMAVAHPGRVRRVALYDAYVYDEQVPAFLRWAQKPGLGELIFALFYKERIEDRAPMAYYDERWVTQQRVERVESEMDRPGTVAAALAVARGHHFAALHTALATFTKPVLLLWGENDQVTPLRFGQRLAAELADARLITYPRCGHIPQVEANVRSTRDLAAFLDLDPSPTPLAPVPTPAEPAPTAPTSTTPGADDGGADDGGANGGGGGGGDGGTSIGGGRASTVSASAGEPVAVPPRPPVNLVAPASDERALPLGADLAALGAELAPRQFAASRETTEVTLHGSLRLRESRLYNFDLDRGLDSRGQPLFAVPLGGGQTLDEGDLRARTDIAIYARGVGVAVKGRIDWLDNVALGGTPDLANGAPATTSGQQASYAVVKRGWAEALTPFGTLAAGRMGTQFGLGIAANSGDCEDCDHGDAADRIAFVTPIASHLWAIAYDVDSRGPFTRSRDGSRAIGLEPSDAVGGITGAVFHVHTPATITRITDAGETSVEYAGYVSSRSQTTDVPASYLPVATPRTAFTSADLTARNFSALATGAWLRVTGARFRIEGEFALASASLGQPSLIPGAELTTAVTSRQLGGALQSDFELGPSQLGFDTGFASGDSAPGFGAYPKLGEAAPTAGAFDGPQASAPSDHTVDNFRFHPDFRIDQILFREIIGTITDAVYVRPHARIALLTAGSSRLEASAALVASWALEATSTPSGARHLGVEIDPELRYVAAGFSVTLDYGLLLPGPAFDSTTLAARPAQTIRARLGFVY